MVRAIVSTSSLTDGKDATEHAEGVAVDGEAPEEEPGTEDECIAEMPKADAAADVD